MKNRLWILALSSVILLSSCNDFNRLVKSTDNEMKYEVAMDYFEKGDYNHALQLFDLLQASFRNTPRGEFITYNTALCYYNQSDYEIAAYYFNRFAQTYPFSKNAEKADYMNAYCRYMLSPESGLDQSNTHDAIKQLKIFVEKYPNSDSLNRANQLMADRYFDGDETEAQLQQAIAQLPDVQKTVFQLRYYDEMKYSEISHITGTSEGALKASYHIAVKKITEFFKHCD